MGAVKAGVGIVRNEVRDGKQTISCPVCGKRILTIKIDDTHKQFDNLLGPGTMEWIVESIHVEAPAFRDARRETLEWRKVVETHIRSHSAAELTERIYKLEDDVAGWQHSADRYSDFLSGLAHWRHYNWPSFMGAYIEAWKKSHKDVPHELSKVTFDE